MVEKEVWEKQIRPSHLMMPHGQSKRGGIKYQQPGIFFTSAVNDKNDLQKLALVV